MIYFWTLAILITVSIYSFTNAGYCPQSYTCSTQCSTQTKTYTSCGILWWSRCTQYKTRYYTCDSTCYRQGCCTGYQGSSCSTPICHGSTSCLNNNRCVSPDNCECRSGYQKPRCEDINECLSNNGGCQHDCSNTVGSFQCSCWSGYTLKTDLKTCEDHNECLHSNGGCDHVCSNTPGTFRCSCHDGYMLSSNGRSCTDKDECTDGTNVCSHECVNTFGSYTCSCETGYQLSSDGKTCLDVDECVQSPYPCDQMCINSYGSFSCSCGSGFYLDVNGKCQDVDECANANGDCSQTCTNTHGSYECSCENGYTLHYDYTTCTDVDECETGTSQCEQICANTPGNYTCDCHIGYNLTDNYSCTDIDDCEGITCENGGNCIDNIGSYTCSCLKGYSGNHCELDIDECVGFLNGGCEDICVNTDGSFHCECQGNTTLQQDGVSCSSSDQPDIFSRYGLIRRFLPRGCSTIVLAKCDDGNDIKLFMSSTSNWYQLRSDPTKIYTYGVVFAEVNSIALPVSITGMEIIKTESDFEIITGSFALDILDGVHYGEERTHFCWTFETTPRDIRDFLSSNSFLASFFYNLEDILPNWMRFTYSGNTIIGISDLQTGLSKGSDIQNSECKDAPVIPDNVYTVLKFGNSFSLSVYGQEVVLPKTVRNKKFCIVVDICQDYGGSIFLVLPEESRNVLDQVNIFKTLITKYGIYIRPVGVGVSLNRRINVNAQMTELQLWNGDEIIHYPLFSEANFWIGGEMELKSNIFRISGKANAFMTVPSPSNLLRGLFLEEWGLFLKVTASAGLEFRFDTPFGNQTLRGNGNGAINALASVGGTEVRHFCGRNANPSGMFFSFTFGANAFIDAGILRFVKPETNARVYAFLSNEGYNFDDSKDIIDAHVEEAVLQLKLTVERFVNLTRDTFSRYQTLLSNTSRTLLDVVVRTGQEFIELVEESTQNGFTINDLQSFITKISSVWSDGWRELENVTETFIDSIRDNTRMLKLNVTELFTNESRAIANRTRVLISELTDEVVSTFKEISGAGFRFNGSLNIFGLKLLGLELELVYSIDSLGSCSRFKRAYEVLKGERAVRIYGGLSTELVQFIPLNSFLQLDDAGFGVGLALSLELDGKFAALLRVEATFLGIKVQTDLFITNKGLYLYIEGNVWNIFKAQIEISAEVGREWYQLSFGLKGTFVADADGDGSFEDGYLAALRRFIQTISDEADKRISKLQDRLTTAQNGLTVAQNWLEEKKSVFRNANSKFDAAVQSLENAKDKLEEAKKPFQDALNKLNDAQRKVDNLCRIKTCKKICIPGIKCRICHKRIWGVKVPYPCCRFTSCMISFPDPVCVLLNLLCAAVRAIAYLALEVAKIFIRIPMLVLDAAKLAVSAAQFIVDKSRIILDIAVAALDIAQVGLEVGKLLLDAAKGALELVKQAVKLGFAALNFVIKYGLENIIDVRNCGFEITMETQDLPVFDVHCEVKAFQTKFRTVRMRINFNNIFQSLWYAAKATIEAILGAIADIFSGRKRRELQHYSVDVLYKLYRETRDTHNTTDSFTNETIDTILSTVGYQNDSAGNDYTSRTKIFEHKCRDFKTVHTFLQDAVEALSDMSHETADTLQNASIILNDLSDYHGKTHIANLTMLEMGIDPSVAETDFNITIETLNDTLERAKENASSDPLLSDVETFSEEANSFLHNQTEDANKINVVNHWVEAMNNVTGEYFEIDACVSFLDCAHYSVALLYSMLVSSNDVPNKEQSLESVSNFENLFLNLTSNVSLTGAEVHDITVALYDNIIHILQLNVFCSVPPVALSLPQNQTVLNFHMVRFVCNVSGNPQPTVWWYKDGEQLTDSIVNQELVIQNVSKVDEGWYHCVAGNLVANLTMPETYLSVIDNNTSGNTSDDTHDDEDKTYDSTFFVVIAVSSSACVLIIIVAVVFCVWYRLRHKFVRGSSHGRDRNYRTAYINTSASEHRDSKSFAVSNYVYGIDARHQLTTNRGISLTEAKSPVCHQLGQNNTNGRKRETQDEFDRVQSTSQSSMLSMVSI